jgi:hypothetical protein
MKKLITRRDFIKYVLSNVTLLTAGNLAFSGQFECVSSNKTCPKCHFPYDFTRKNIFSDSIAWVESYCPNCGISLRTLKHNINCDQYARCRHQEFLANEKNRNSQDVCGVCWKIPFATKESRQYTKKPWINLNELNF